MISRHILVQEVRLIESHNIVDGTLQQYIPESVQTTLFQKNSFPSENELDFIFVLILVRIRNDFFEVINKYGNP